MKAKNMKEDEVEWKKKLTKEQFYILRKKGTEKPFANKYWNNHEKGIYKCAGCGELLFSSNTKFDSGTGWPSFFQSYKEDKIKEEIDRKFGMRRTEVQCNKCGGHLGHVFNDGPNPTGLRYCLNSASLDFIHENKD